MLHLGAGGGTHRARWSDWGLHSKWRDWGSYDDGRFYLARGGEGYSLPVDLLPRERGATAS